MKAKTKEIEKTVKEIVTTYVAGDGVEFKTEEECKKYEESALYALSVRVLNKTLIPLPTNYKEKRLASIYFGLDFLFPCSDDCAFYIFIPKTEQDIKDFIQYAKLQKSDIFKYYKKFNAETYPELAEKLINGSADADKWDQFRAYCLAEEIKPGKAYIYSYYNDDYDTLAKLYEMDRYVETVKNILDDYKAYAENQLKK